MAQASACVECRSIEGLALEVGGQFLQGHVLIIEPLDGGSVTWDNESILQDFPSQWSAPDLVTARYHEADEPIDTAQTHRPIHGIFVELPLGVRLVVNRWSKHLDVTIHMHAQAGGQDGHCGNFDGDASDDTVDLIKERMELKVSKGDLLPTPSAFADDAGAKVKEMSVCPPSVRVKAEAQCRQALGAAAAKQVFEACVFDHCFGGKDFDA